MSRKSRMQDLRAKKDRRTKIVAIGGAVLLAIILAWELPHYLGGSKAPAATTTSASSASTTTTPTTGVPTTATGTAAAAVLPTSSSTKLENSDVLPARTKSQLYSFSRFTSKNPFVPQVSAPTAASSGSPAGTTAASSPSAPTSAPSAPPAASGVTGSAMAKPANVVGQATSASIEVNGKIETVQIGSPFPSSSPVFKLVSITSKGAKIGISNGGFSNGKQAASLAVGRSLTLVNKTNGRRYVVLLLSVS